MGKYVGAVKSFNAVKGWGFIECMETHQIYGKDILFQKSELPGPVEKGDQLSFNIAQGRNGVLAVGLELLNQVTPQKPEWSEAMVPGSGNYMGTIKSYSVQNGWGFVECVDTQRIYGKDILILKDELRGVHPTPGQRVAFSVSQGRKGPLATSVRMMPAAIGAIGALPALSAIHDMGAQARSATPGMKRKFQELQMPSMPSGPSFWGTIKSFNLTRGWGFIQSPETEATYGKDILVLRDELAGATVVPGQRVSFSVTQGRNGPLATDIQLLVPAGAAAQLTVQAQAMFNPVAAAPPARGVIANGAGGRLAKPQKAPDPAEHVCGSIKSFDEEKGWGFVTGEAIVKLYGKDVYISKAVLHGQTVSLGDQVMFSVEMGMKGPMASGVKILPVGSFIVEGVSGNVFVGSIKSFNAEKGWGFVTSEETLNIFGKDLFLHKRELSGAETLNAGDQVQFSVQLSTGGRPEAANVFPLAHDGASVQGERTLG